MLWLSLPLTHGGCHTPNGQFQFTPCLPCLFVGKDFPAIFLFTVTVLPWVKATASLSRECTGCQLWLAPETRERDSHAACQLAFNQSLSFGDAACAEL